MIVSTSIQCNINHHHHTILSIDYHTILSINHHTILSINHHTILSIDYQMNWISCLTLVLQSPTSTPFSTKHWSYPFPLKKPFLMQLLNFTSKQPTLLLNSYTIAITKQNITDKQPFINYNVYFQCLGYFPVISQITIFECLLIVLVELKTLFPIFGVILFDHDVYIFSILVQHVIVLLDYCFVLLSHQW